MFFFFSPQAIKTLGSAAFLVALCSTAIADPVTLRDSIIHINIDHSGQYKVLIDDMDVAPYSTKTSAGIDLVNPFPEKSSAFTVRIVSMPDKVVIFEETYQKAAPGQIFDQIDTVTSGQFDGSFISPSKTRPEPEEGFDKNEAQSAALGLVQVSGTRGAYKSLFELEGVHRSQPDERLREEGPAADISRFRLRNELATTSGATFYATVGDLEITSTNSLVNTGVSSRGLVLGFESAGESVLFEVGRVFGTDIVGAVHGPVAWAEDSYRNSVRTRVVVFDGDKVNVALTGSYLDVKRAAESSFGLADTPVGETNETWGVGTEITAFEELIRADLSWAKSRYDNPRELLTRQKPTRHQVITYCTCDS